MDQHTRATIKYKDDSLKEIGRRIEEYAQYESMDRKLDLMKKLTEVSSSIHDQIREDFIFAKLDEKDKEAVSEMTTNAYFSKSIINLYRKLRTKWEWNTQQKKWQRCELSQKETDYLKHYEQRVFDTFMTRIYMTVILNRNVTKNALVRILAGFDETEEETKEEKQKQQKTTEELIKSIEKREEK